MRKDEGDPILLRELMGNLLDNSLRYCPAGSEVTLEVATNDDIATISVTKMTGLRTSWAGLSLTTASSAAWAFGCFPTWA